MKKYPKNLADAIVLAEVAEHLYEKADDYERQIEDYKESLNEENANSWIAQTIAQLEAKMNAYIRLAEKLTK